MLLLTLGCALITKDQYADRIAGGDDTGGDCASEDVLSWYEDSDGDGFGRDDVSLEACDQPSGYVSDNSDCDDNTAGIYPGANEICNGASDDCDSEIDESPIDGRAFAPDVDEDGYADMDRVEILCEGSAPLKWIPAPVDSEHDCDDQNAAVNPAADEICNETDDDCDGAVDEDAIDAPTWWVDGDGDGYGDPDSPLESCDPGGDVVDNDLDCDDTNEDVSPDEDEHEGDGLDNDCDGGATRITGAEGAGNAAYSALYGAAENTVAGTGFGQIGDVNGDGAEDLLIAASTSVASDGAYQGQVWLFHGPITGGFATLDEASAARFVPDVDGNAWLGWAVAGAKNLTGSGTTTLLMSAPVVGAGGEVYLVESDVTDAVDPTDYISLSTDGADELLGYSLSVGDFDDDGQDDFAVGAPGAAYNGAYSGSAFIVHGPVTSDITIAKSDGHYKGRVSTQNGTAMDAGDVDGDGMSDLVMSAIYANGGGVNSGEVYIAYGPATGNALSSSLRTLTGEAAGDETGNSISVGDTNADGYEDVLIGASAADIGSANSGGVFLVLGPVAADINLENAEALFDGSGINTYFGSDVKVLGDLDQDGVDDIAIGAKGAGAGNGLVAFWYGPVSGVESTTSADFSVVGQSSGDSLSIVSPVGDFLGTGTSFALGAPTRTYGGNSYAGMAYFFEHPQL